MTPAGREPPGAWRWEPRVPGIKASGQASWGTGGWGPQCTWCPRSSPGGWVSEEGKAPGPQGPLRPGWSAEAGPPARLGQGQMWTCSGHERWPSRGPEHVPSCGSVGLPTGPEQTDTAQPSMTTEPSSAASASRATGHRPQLGPTGRLSQTDPLRGLPGRHLISGAATEVTSCSRLGTSAPELGSTCPLRRSREHPAARPHPPTQPPARDAERVRLKHPGSPKPSRSLQEGHPAGGPGCSLCPAPSGEPGH